MCASNTVVGKAIGVQSDEELDRLNSDGTPEGIAAAKALRESKNRTFDEQKADGDTVVNGKVESRNWSQEKLDALAAQVPADHAAPPDLTDSLVRESRKRQALKLTSATGRRSTFITGSMGDASAKPLNKTLLGGY